MIPIIEKYVKGIIMLKKFSVTNFKNFKDTTIFDFSSPANYEFNTEVIHNNCVSKAIIYGINGSGKSNLALAIFDIVLHLTDKQKLIDRYYPYLNMDSNKELAEFEYCFNFLENEVIYRYGKKDPVSLVYEKVLINGKEVLSYDFSQNRGYTNLSGAENLQLSSTLNTETNKLSRVKYVNNNSLLKDNSENRAFIAFTSFVDNMLMFYSLMENRYQGFTVGIDNYTQGIIRENKVKEFEEFLKEEEINYQLIVSDFNGTPELFCKFKNGNIPFLSIASTGTRSLALFYYWYLKMNKASLVFIDEYDAFYHFELSQELIKLVKKITNTQIIVSTHNTDLITNDILRPDAYFIIKNNQIKSFDKLTEKELRRAHNLQKMYKAGAF